jgi:hypothetical protein
VFEYTWSANVCFISQFPRRQTYLASTFEDIVGTCPDIDRIIISYYIQQKFKDNVRERSKLLRTYVQLYTPSKGLKLPVYWDFRICI